MKRRKKISIIAFLVLFTIIIVFVLFETFYYKPFDRETWLSDPSNRTEIIDGLLKEYTLVGKTKDYIINLLGNPSYNENDTLYYDLGPERGIPIDNEFLELEYKDNIIISVKNTVH